MSCMIFSNIRRLLLSATYIMATSSLTAAENISFYPSSAANVSFAELTALDFIEADYKLPYGGENEDLQFGKLWLPEIDKQYGNVRVPLIVFIHGGCWLNEYDIRHTFPFSTALAQAGYAVWSLEYRRTGDPGGGWPGTFMDVVKGIAFANTLADYGVDTSRMIITGHSAGGHLALLAGQAIPEAQAVIGLAAISDIVDYSLGRNSCQTATSSFMGGDYSQIPKTYQLANPVAKLQHRNTILLHGTRDAIVPLAQSQVLNATVLQVEGAGHFDWVHPGTEAFRQLLNMIEESLLP